MSKDRIANVLAVAGVVALVLGGCATTRSTGVVDGSDGPAFSASPGLPDSFSRRDDMPGSALFERYPELEQQSP